MLYSTYLWLIFTVGAFIWLLVLLHTLRYKRFGIWPFSFSLPLSLPFTSRIPSLVGTSETQCILPHKASNLGKVAGVYSIQGQRAHMEDSYYGDYTAGYFAVYDGHGGARCSEYITQHLHDSIFKHNVHAHPENALCEGFRDLDDAWLKLATHNSWDDGSTAVCCLCVNNTLYIASVGDSRAVLSHAKKAIDMTSDHKPSRPDEKSRIEALGGRIIHYGTWRVEGVLAVTRAFGDRRLKKYVSAVPEIQARHLQPEDDWLILASDGVWDVISSQHAVDMVNTINDPKQAAEAITMHAYQNHSADNITCMVVDLRHYHRN